MIKIEKNDQFKGSELQRIIDHHFLSLSQIAERLHTTRKEVKRLVNENKLVPSISKPDALLFRLKDINHLQPEYTSKANRIWSDQTGTTHKSLKFFSEHKEYLDQIKSIYVYFNHMDAILDGYYEIPSMMNGERFQYLDSPLMIIRDIKEQEVWLGGCNCGYGGTGPHGSMDLLTDLGLDNEMVQLIPNHHVVKYLRDPQDASWEAICHKGTGGGVYLHQNQFTLLNSSPDSEALEFVQRYQQFIPDPISLTIFENNEEITENDYYCEKENEFYNTVIQDRSGRKICLNPMIYNQPLNQQDHWIGILNTFGFSMPENESFFDKIKRAFSD
ncbi:hypothetical protein [Mechercharimyces sp. CAU 1602]|uniref:hypothetical protein n=1 Tax=Mechercharimyces sp. CAU 1602 TaxID=2973933 RepID=UPI0021624996|nr:hypothetical protein [Mechercharimyces sp. CAU 1602]MCS1352792.1 hypothetical protein [Mechercharimyces sp. CAU 1602]